MNSDERLDRLWRSTRSALSALLVLGTLAALLRAEVGVIVVIVAAAGLTTTEIALALIKYRRTMRRCWPAVAPLPDDDDW